MNTDVVIISIHICTDYGAITIKNYGSQSLIVST